ncbi:PPC domain-containing protein [Tychonema sp. BBK16]|uniref:PPC domain-containing protein n=1 Tax=Tychonema sp. BBK16 TaxID=2699888 RepID=UPI001F30D28E|nr:PPC domain-containing protein [Tychonema sp. BBK16]MCF6375820.1 PPC domain-containing protein [Tychonema sp. BBK16]
MSQVKFWAIALIALLINFSGKSVASSPVYILGQETPKSSPSAMPTPSTLPIPAAGSSKVILEKKAELTPAKSLVLPSDSSLYDEYRFEGTKGQTVVISLESTEFDTYLGVFDSQGELLGENDNATDKNTNSELTITLSSNGVCLVIVNALQPPPKGKGKYSLTIRERVKN